MTSISVRKFQRRFDLDLIVASRENLTVGDMVWDAAGITPPKLDKPGMPRNIFNALEILGEISKDQRKSLQADAAKIPLADAGMANISTHVSGHHAGDFRYPLIVNVTTNIDIEKLSSFSFTDIKVRVMPNDMRVTTDRLLNEVKRKSWKDFDLNVRRAFIITELYYGGISVTIDRNIASEADISVLTEQGFKLKSSNASHKQETYSMDVCNVPFAMRTELARRFAS